MAYCMQGERKHGPAPNARQPHEVHCDASNIGSNIGLYLQVHNICRAGKHRHAVMSCQSPAAQGPQRRRGGASRARLGAAAAEVLDAVHAVEAREQRGGVVGAVPRCRRA